MFCIVELYQEKQFGFTVHGIIHILYARVHIVYGDCCMKLQQLMCSGKPISHIALYSLTSGGGAAVSQLLHQVDGRELSDNSF